MDRLPILKHEEEILMFLEEYPVVVVVGETGSGKTTQIPLFLHRAGHTAKGKIGITQPRRIAAISIAEYVAECLGSKIGEKAGYKIRFDDESASSPIKFMTDGILLREAQLDPDLKEYSVIMVDEAHERSLNIDFVLGILKSALKRRNDLKVIVTSATIDPKKFADYFNGAPIISVSGRTYSVEVIYSPPPKGVEWIERAVETVAGICARPYTNDDVLVFMPGKDTISEFCSELAKKVNRDRAEILPLHGAMMPEEQRRIFSGFGRRKVVVATNIAETSITVDGIVHVVDSGLIKMTGYDPMSGIGSLDTVKHSQAGSEQRKGRAGRTQEGICIRLFSEADFLSRPKFTEPEIKRTDLAGVVLQMKAMGIKNVVDFDFIDPPDPQAFRDAHETLRTLGALDGKDDLLTAIGKTMASLPLAPRLSRMLISARERGCVKEVAIIAASLSQRSVFDRKEGEERMADIAHERFRNRKSDFLTFLNVIYEYLENDGSRDWCRQNYLHWRNLEEIWKIYQQILQLLEREGFELSKGAEDDEISKAVATGLAQNICEKDGRHSFRRGETLGVFIHPSSSLFNSWAEGRFMVCAEMVTTTKCFARGCAVIEPQWLPEIVPNLCRKEIAGLLRCNSLAKTAIAEEVIYFKGERVFRRELELPMDEAKALQNKLIRRAEARGWKLMSLASAGRYSSGWAIDKQGKRYPLSSNLFGFEPGSGHYCEISEFYGEKMAEQKFRVLELPNVEMEFRDDAEEPADDESPDSLDLNPLLEKWGKK